MALPWRTVAEADTPDGKLTLRRRGERDVLLTIDGRVLMSSMAFRSEVQLVRLAAEKMTPKEHPRVLIAGLGLGFSLEAALEVLPEKAQIVVCELNEDLVNWARGPIADLVAPLLEDPRVTVIIDDVSRVIARTAAVGGKDRFDAIILDLYSGPNEEIYGRKSPLYGSIALANTRDALMGDGVFAVWSEEADAVFEKRLRSIGFDADRMRSRGKGPRYVIYLATHAPARPKAAPSPGGTGRPSGPGGSRGGARRKTSGRKPGTRSRPTGGRSNPGRSTGGRTTGGRTADGRTAGGTPKRRAGGRSASRPAPKKGRDGSA